MINNRCIECQVTEKECTRCKIMKPLSDYVKRNTASDGRSSDCKVCYNRRIRAKKYTERTTIRVNNPYKKGSTEHMIYGFFGQHQIKLQQEELNLICQKLKESQTPLTTLDGILADYQVGINEYIMEFENESKSVLQYEIEDKGYLIPIGRFDSLVEASVFLRGDKGGVGSISSAARNGMTGLGYRWAYEK